MSARTKARKRALDVLFSAELRDELLTRFSKDWSLKRMPTVDRNVLRLGVFELVFRDENPDPGAVSEAVELVRDLSTDDSPTFVSGVLSAIMRDKPAVGG